MTQAVTVWQLALPGPGALRPPARPLARELVVERVTTPGTSERFYRTVGAPWQWTDRLHWTPDRWAAWEARVETHVARADGLEAGYVELDPRPGVCEVAYLGLLPGFEGFGLGGHLLTHGARCALELAPRVEVSTCSLDGPHALANYRARGFVETSERTVLR